MTPPDDSKRTLMNSSASVSPGPLDTLDASAPESAETPVPSLAGEPARDPISGFVHSVIELFGGPLAAVRFPDADHASLTSLAATAREAQREVEALEASLEEARASTRAAQEALHDHATRALAYARVFATGQAELEEALLSVRAPGRVEGRVEPREAKSAGPEAGEAKRRGRPRKATEPSEPMLPIDAPSLAATSLAAPSLAAPSLAAE